MRRSSYYIVSLLSIASIAVNGCEENPADSEPLPVAIFSWSGGTRAPATITFENLSQNADEYYWRFGDGTASTDKNPVHIFSNPGLYAVILSAVRSSNGATNETNQFLTITATPPVVDFTWSGDTVTPATITFQNLTRNADDYLWDFGDGRTSIAANPIHIFYGARTFRVRLTASERASGQSATRSKDLRIVWPDPVADFDWSGRTVVDSYIQLNNRSLNADDFVWKFSDGSPSISGLEGPRIIRYEPVNLYVTLVARNSSTTKADSVTKLLAISP